MFKWEWKLFLRKKRWSVLVIFGLISIAWFFSSKQVLFDPTYTGQLEEVQNYLTQKQEIDPVTEELFLQVYNTERQEKVALRFNSDQESYVAILQTKAIQLEQLLERIREHTNLTTIPVDREVALFQYAIENDIDLLSIRNVLEPVFFMILLLQVNILPLVFIVLTAVVIHFDFAHKTVIEKASVMKHSRLYQFIFLVGVGYIVPLVFFSSLLLLLAGEQSISLAQMPITYFANGQLQVNSIMIYIGQVVAYQSVSLVLWYQVIRLMAYLTMDIVLILFVALSSWLPLILPFTEITPFVTSVVNTLFVFAPASELNRYVISNGLLWMLIYSWILSGFIWLVENRRHLFQR